MPFYSIVAEVIQTRGYMVMASTQEEAMDALRADYEYMEYDVLENVLDTTEVQEID